MRDLDNGSRCVHAAHRRPADPRGRIRGAVRERGRVGYAARPTRLALQLRPGCAAAVRDLTERESQCCSFFTFTVRDEPDGVVLDIEVPGAYTGVLDGMEANIFGRRV